MNQLSLDEPERWLPVAGYEGRYEVSDLGRVRSLPLTKPGNWRNWTARFSQRLLWVPDTGQWA